MRNRPLSHLADGVLITIPIFFILLPLVSASYEEGVVHDHDSSAHPDLLPPELCAPYTSSLPHAAVMHLRDLIQNRQVQSRIIRDLETLIQHKIKAMEVRRVGFIGFHGGVTWI